jgi:hypothetical protein
MRQTHNTLFSNKSTALPFAFPQQEGHGDPTWAPLTYMQSASDAERVRV